MQNSKLTNIIIPNLAESWKLFIQKVTDELRQLKTDHSRENNRCKELSIHIPKLAEMKRKCNDNIKEIYNYRIFLSYVDDSLELKNFLNGLDYLKEHDNMDNDAVKSLYNSIINYPRIVSLNEEYDRLLLKTKLNKDQIKTYENLINEEVINISLITELLDKYDLPDNIKKNVLTYALAMSSKKEYTSDKEVSSNKTNAKFGELLKIYEEINKNNQELIARCLYNYKNINESQRESYEKIASKWEEISSKDFNKGELLKIYMVAFVKTKQSIESLTESVKDLRMDDISLNKEVNYFKILIKKYNKLIEIITSLTITNEEIIDDEDRVFFAHNTFNILLIDKEILRKNIDSFEKYINEVNNSSNRLDDDVETYRMLGVDEVEDLLDKRINVLKTLDYKLAYVMVDDNVLVISIADISDFNFERGFVRLVKTNANTLKKQIKYIETKDKEYLKLQSELKEDLLNQRKK